MIVHPIEFTPSGKSPSDWSAKAVCWNALPLSSPSVGSLSSSPFGCGKHACPSNLTSSGLNHSETKRTALTIKVTILVSSWCHSLPSSISGDRFKTSSQDEVLNSIFANRRSCWQGEHLVSQHLWTGPLDENAVEGLVVLLLLLLLTIHSFIGFYLSSPSIHCVASRPD